MIDFHKLQCFLTLNPNVRKYLIKIGGATTNNTLFQTDIDKKNLLQFINKSDFSLKYKPDDILRDGLRPNEYDRTLTIAYLIVFEKLFISGDYDHLFEQNEFTITLKEM